MTKSRAAGSGKKKAWTGQKSTRTPKITDAELDRREKAQQSEFRLARLELAIRHLQDNVRDLWEKMQDYLPESETEA